MPTNQPDTLEIPGLAALNRLFEKELWLHKFNSAGSTYSEIKKVIKASKKAEMIQVGFQEWMDGSVSAIKSFFPQYVQLGRTFQSLLGSDPVVWAEKETWWALRGQCGVKRFGEDGSHDFLLLKWWLSIATELNFEVNLTDANDWLAPQWLTKSKSRSATYELFEKFLDRLSLTFYKVLDEEKERARVWVALNSSSSRELRNKWQHGTLASTAKRTGRKKTLTKDKKRRQDVILNAILMNYKGLDYCRFLDAQRLHLPSAWIDSECPATDYASAYKAGGTWQKRIQDEKSRYQRKYGRTPSRECEAPR